MRIIALETSIVVGAAVCAFAAASGAVSAATLIPLQQQRSTNGFVIVPPCGPDTSEIGGEQAAAFELFESVVVVDLTCKAASGSALSVQFSQILPQRLSADAEVASFASSTVPTVIHAIPSTLYEVTFQLDQAARFQMSGELTASGALPVVFGGAMVRLRHADGTTIFDHSLSPDATGTLISLNLDERGVLAAGTYTLHASAESVIDSMVPPGGSGDASFEFIFDIADFADLNGDGVVDGLDLGILMGNWSIPAGSPGCEGAVPCSADLNGDGVVDGLDLGMLLDAWTGA